MADEIFFTGWAGPLRVIVTAPLVYGAVVASIRATGKRATSQMNNFDWIVTVAIGSIVGSCIVLPTVPVVDALVAVAVLFGMQFGVTWLTTRSELVEHVVKARPTLVLERGRYVVEAMRRERLSVEEVRAAIRRAGFTSEHEVGAVILESDAELSVVPASSLDGNGSTSALDEVEGSKFGMGDRPGGDAG
jgi:uncharacterized membrane protein YcaP (DUF421 family)